MSIGQDDVVLTSIDSPLGALTAAACRDGLCLLEYALPHRLESQVNALRRLFGGKVADGDNEHLRRIRAELADYFAGRLTTFTVPLRAPGTPFQERVWSELLKIPYGETRSYEDLATAAGVPLAQRAVGRANGTNRIAIVIPCHRVINKNGKLGGYGGEVWRKKALLALERAAPPLFG